MNKETTLSFNFDKLKSQYSEHEARCKEIAKEVNKWGKKTKQSKLNFLKKGR